MSMISFFTIGVAIVTLGIGIVIDGFGSIVIQSGQYHNTWFDGERYVRGMAGVVLLFLGLIVAGVL